jgi:5-methylcytosine-specific restriction endonuclease McrA
MVETLLFPKPRPHHLVRKDRKAERKRVIRAVREVVRRRDVRCRSCQGIPHPGAGRLEMHEIKSRAHLRGNAPEVIFNTGNCLMLCTACHREVTEHRLFLVPTSDDGADGEVLIKQRKE